MAEQFRDHQQGQFIDHARSQGRLREPGACKDPHSAEKVK
jgi:hypothetical protein